MLLLPACSVNVQKEGNGHDKQVDITAGTNTAWAERQAASFTATPLVCGSGALRHPSQAPTSIDPDGAFVPTTRFAGLETLKRLRELWPRKLLIKGVERPDDAERAAALGLDGVVVSNHGGRQLDGAAVGR